LPQVLWALVQLLNKESGSGQASPVQSPPKEER
jgi:hypothetical protein